MDDLRLSKVKRDIILPRYFVIYDYQESSNISVTATGQPGTSLSVSIGPIGPFPYDVRVFSIAKCRFTISAAGGAALDACAEFGANSEILDEMYVTSASSSTTRWPAMTLGRYPLTKDTGDLYIRLRAWKTDAGLTVTAYQVKHFVFLYKLE